MEKMPYLRSLHKRDLAKMKESTAGQVKRSWSSMARFTYKINLEMLGLLSQEKESFTKEQAWSIPSQGECAKTVGSTEKSDRAEKNKCKHTLSK